VTAGDDEGVRRLVEVLAGVTIDQDQIAEFGSHWDHRPLNEAELKDHPDYRRIEATIEAAIEVAIDHVVARVAELLPAAPSGPDTLQ
jgi:hypothetical protein